MRITFLGTGTSMGIPLIGCTCKVCRSTNPKDKRLRCAILVEQEDTIIAVDCGPDFRMQMLRAGVQRLDAILVTHEHNDHLAGLDDVRAFNLWQQEDMNVYATPRLQAVITKRFDYVFQANKYPGAPAVALNDIHEEAFKVGAIEVQPFTVIHGNLPVTCFRFGDFTYITDASFIDEKEMEKIKGSKVLVINALRKEPDHWSHFLLDQALEVIEELKPEKAYLIHMSHQMGLHEEVQKELPPNVYLSYDTLTLKL